MPNFQSILLDHEGKLRSGWRVAVFAFFYSLILGIVAGSIGMFLFVDGDPGTLPKYLYWIVSGVLGLGTAITVGWLCGKYFEKLPFDVLGASPKGKWFIHFAFGLLAGTATVLLAVAAAFAFGGERFAVNVGSGTSQIAASLALSFAVFAVAAAAEEALFRGYILQTLDRAGLAWLAVILTSAFFGFVHLGNPNAGLISTANTVLAGVWFGLAYLRFRDLWFVTGMHLTWNWVQGSIFGIEVSGLRELSEHPLLHEIDTGPTWLTGETYGIEGGVAATIAIAMSIGALVFFFDAKAQRRGVAKEDT